MKIQMLLVTAVSAGVVGLAYAGSAEVSKKKPVVLPAPPSLLSNVAQGNSVWPTNTLKLKNGKLLIGGLVNLDSYISTNTKYTLVPQFGTNLSNGGTSKTITPNNINVFLGSDMGFAHARLNFGYFDRRSVKTPAGPSIGGQNNFLLDEGYLSLYDSKKLPLYIKAGKFYDTVGSYNPYQLIPDLTSLFTQEGVTGVEVGAASKRGFYASLAGFTGAATAVNPKVQTDSALSTKFGYVGTCNGIHWGADVGYISTMHDLSYLNSYDFTSNLSSGVASFNGKSAVVAADFFANVQQFDITTKYTQFTNENLTLNNPTAGVAAYPVDKPWAMALGLGYSFETFNHPSRVGAGYQMTRHAQYLFMPADRYLLNYSIGLSQRVSMELAYYYDQSYVYAGPSGADRNYQTGMISHNDIVALRLSAHF